MKELEEIRSRVIRKTSIIGIITTLISIVIAITIAWQLVFFVLVLGVVICLAFTHKDTKLFNNLYKQKVVISTFNSICDNVEFNLDRGIDYKTIADTRMMYMGDRFYSNDYVTGEYKNIHFESSDVHIQEESTDSDGNTTYTTIFRGQWYIFDFNKSFKSNIQVCERFFPNAKLNNLFAKNKYKKVELEDINFNKIFRVYAQNELDAFYILTPNTMEKIKAIKEKIKGKLLFCFIDNKLHIALHNGKDLFETNIYKKIDLEKSTSKTKEEIGIITNFVDILRLDNDLFKSKGGE